jgi:hypothetical protein
MADGGRTAGCCCCNLIRGVVRSKGSRGFDLDLDPAVYYAVRMFSLASDELGCEAIDLGYEAVDPSINDKRARARDLTMRNVD